MCREDGTLFEVSASSVFTVRIFSNDPVLTILNI